jgi:hypothetical protein
MTRRLNSRRTRELDLRVAWLLMLLYPRAWRDRYGAEVLRLTRELVAAGETTPARAAVDLACAAVAERCRVLGNSWRPAMAMTAAVLVAVAGSAYVTGHARRAHHASTVSPVSAAPARATLAGALCSFPRLAADAVMTGRPATVTGLVPAGPTFTLSLPAGPRVIPSPRLLVPVIFALPGQGARRLCVEPPARCRIGTGYVVKVTPSRPVVRVTVKRAGCVPVAPDKAGTSGP